MEENEEMNGCMGFLINSLMFENGEQVSRIVFWLLVTENETTSEKNMGTRQVKNSLLMSTL